MSTRVLTDAGLVERYAAAGSGPTSIKPPLSARIAAPADFVGARLFGWSSGLGLSPEAVRFRQRTAEIPIAMAAPPKNIACRFAPVDPARRQDVATVTSGDFVRQVQICHGLKLISLA